MLTGSFPLTLSKVQLLLAQLLGVELSCGAHSDRRQRLSSALEVVTSEAHQAAQQQPVADGHLEKSLLACHDWPARSVTARDLTPGGEEEAEFFEVP